MDPENVMYVCMGGRHARWLALSQLCPSLFWASSAAGMRGGHLPTSTILAASPSPAPAPAAQPVPDAKYTEFIDPYQLQQLHGPPPIWVLDSLKRSPLYASLHKLRLSHTHALHQASAPGASQQPAQGPEPAAAGNAGTAWRRMPSLHACAVAALAPHAEALVELGPAVVSVLPADSKACLAAAVRRRGELTAYVLHGLLDDAWHMLDISAYAGAALVGVEDAAAAQQQPSSNGIAAGGSGSVPVESRGGAGRACTAAPPGPIHAAPCLLSDVAVRRALSSLPRLTALDISGVYAIR